MAAELSIITPGILIIRMERLLEYISNGNTQAAIRMCKNYSEDIEKKACDLFEREQANHISDVLFETELLLMLNASSIAQQKVRTIADLITKPLINYGMIRKRLMNEKNSTEDSIGSLSGLPIDVLRAVVDNLQTQYCW
jgi:anaerobic ribonucleoside-triphosphate reductase